MMMIFGKFSLVISMLLASSKLADAQQTSAEWEEELVEAWRTIADCSPETGMCDACGFGVAVVDITGDQAETRTYNVGNGDREAPWGPDDTWEIASITKPFTAVATLIMEEEGLVNAEESTIGDFLDCDWSQANSDVASVTLLEIIQHQSGFPAQPPDRGPTIDGNPFGNYTEERLCASLLKLNGLPTRGRYSYSNYAYGTLGYVLTLAADKENPPAYEEIIKEKILIPLQMFNTSVTFDEAGWEKAAEGCSRGLSRGEETIRLGEYVTLQGNGALRSSLNDMAKYLLVALYVDAGMPEPADEGLWGGLPPPSDGLTKVYNALKIAHSEIHREDLACSCVSDWCEGLLCPLPNPNDEFITPGGFEGYTSGGVLTWRKSGDTGGYSSRVAYSAAKGRAAVAIDTCGGCGSKGTAGSGAQRSALLLVDGPPTLEAVPQEPSGPINMLFHGDAHSHNFPSVAEINIEVRTIDDDTVSIALSSSDGAGASSTAKAAGNGVWIVQEPIFMGTGWGATSDPFTELNQQRTLIIAPDGMTATYQDMGSDTSLTLLMATIPESDAEDDAEEDTEEETDNDPEEEVDLERNGGFRGRKWL